MAQLNVSGAPRVLASTTSHKREPLLSTLDIFARIGLRDLDLNLYHILEAGVRVDAVMKAVKKHDLRLWVMSGGWCDFYDTSPEIEKTFASVARQVAIASECGVNIIRLFFGRLKYESYSPGNLEIICNNLVRLSEVYPHILFVLENHDGASLHPEVCRDVLAHVNRGNVRMNFDPINFERSGTNSIAALELVRPLIGHVHLKGLHKGEYCEFGEGDVDLMPLLRSLIGNGYQGWFTVEYEGKNDGTLRLYESVLRARAVIADLTHSRA